MKTKSKKRVIVIGFDGATFDLILPLIKKKKLPNFEKLIKNYSWGNLKSTILPISPAAWSSFITGKNPGKHGVFDFTERDENSYTQVPITSQIRKSEAIWDILAKSNKKSIIINIPGTYPPEEINGLMISGFPTPEISRKYTYPLELLDELEKNLGNCFIQPDDFFAEGNQENFLKCEYRCFNNTKKITDYLMENKEWDFFMSVFAATDAFSHGLWRYLDKNHPFFNKKDAKKYAKHIEKIYVKSDDFLGKIIKKVDKDKNTTLVVMSDHGFGPIYYTFYMNNWLYKNKYLYFKKNILSLFRIFLYKIGLNLNNAFDIATKLRLTKIGFKKIFPTKESDMKKTTFQKLMKIFFLNFEDVDWERTKAYSTGNFGQIYINLKGREPEGIVDKSDYMNLTNELISKIKKIKDPYTGKTVFENVFFKDEIYKGDHVDKAPDIIYYDNKLIYSAARMFEFGTNKLVTKQVIGRSGGHKFNGIFLSYGDNIEKQKLENLNIIDIAPTILAILNSKIPKDIDGKVIEEMFKKKVLVKKYESKSMKIKEKEKVKNQDKDLMKEKLKGLGYFT